MHVNAPVRKTLAGLAGLVTAAGLTLVGAPGAQAAGQGTVWEIWNNYNGLYLDSDVHGNVYTLQGNSGTHQLWAERAGNRRSNAATGLCLQARGVGSEAMTSTCTELSTTQEWVHESHPGGVVIKNLSLWPRKCLASGNEPYNDLGARKVFVEDCTADKRQLWSVKRVF